jgi:UDP-glucose 6-dehydrogenase
MNITIVGSGYVGLVTGACFAEVGHHVICVDNNEQKVATLQKGEVRNAGRNGVRLLRNRSLTRKPYFRGKVQPQPVTEPAA